MTNHVDPQHGRRPAFDKDTGRTGQGYTIDDERRLGEQMLSGSVAPRPSQVPDGSTEAGRRAWFDSVTGAVHGSGASAGGGHEGEHPDQDRSGGLGTAIDEADDRST